VCGAQRPSHRTLQHGVDPLMLMLLLVQQVVLVPGSACLPLPVPLAYECPASPLTPTALPTRNRIRPPHPAQAPYTTRPDCPGQRTRSSSTAPHHPLPCLKPECVKKKSNDVRKRVALRPVKITGNEDQRQRKRQKPRRTSLGPRHCRKKKA
jgi:hypothetical protein